MKTLINKSGLINCTVRKLLSDKCEFHFGLARQISKDKNRVFSVYCNKKSLYKNVVFSVCCKKNIIS